MRPTKSAFALRGYRASPDSLSKENRAMHPHAKTSLKRGNLLFIALSLFLLTVLSLWAADAPAQKVFPTADAAWKALVAGMEQKDTAALKAILGPGCDDLLSSGDSVADANAGEKFLQVAQEKTSLVSVGDNRTVAFLGKEDWPFPIPMVKGTGGWTFDTAVGAEEMVNRRIGKNELYTIAIMHAYVDAQNEFSALHKEPHYAQKFFSTEGQHDGLYWKVKEGEPDSPLGPLAAEAAGEGYTKAEPGGARKPLHGYFFKILTAQGKDAPGGEKTFINKEGKMTGGFALVAWPSNYGASGVMTFIVNQQGIVFQRDLGPGTPETVQAFTAYNPGPNWTPVKD